MDALYKMIKFMHSMHAHTRARTFMCPHTHTLFIVHHMTGKKFMLIATQLLKHVDKLIDNE